MGTMMASASAQLALTSALLTFRVVKL